MSAARTMAHGMEESSFTDSGQTSICDARFWGEKILLGSVMTLEGAVVDEIEV